MFGSSPGPQKDKDIEPVPASDTTNADSSGPGAISLKTEDLNTTVQKRNSLNQGRKATEDTSSPTTEKKRRSSSVAKASALFSSAKNHLTGSQSEKAPPLTPMQKLGKTDPALSVPQGSNNNSAGESAPTPRSSFRVGVTEDKNKKCRRTMEDTHAYLYNFLGTPAPALPLEASKKSLEDKESINNESTSDVSTHVVETDNGYFAIFDGHAGTFAADWCGKKLHIILEDLMRKNPNTPVPELLDQTFTSADQQLEKLPLKNSGCTAITAVLRWEDRVPNSQSATGSTAIAPAAAAAVKATESDSVETPTQDTATANSATPETASKAIPKLQETASRSRVLYTANVGDARIVLCRNGKALRLSYDHKGSDENEGKRIANAGGLILNNRVNGVLAVTRALGDSYLKDLVTGHPYTTETVIQPDIDEFLILACDGLWDVCSDQEAVDLIRNTASPQVASKQLVDHALARFSTDNLSVMVIRFDSKTLAANTSIGVEGDPASRKKGGVSEVEMIVSEAKRKTGLGLTDGAVSSTDSTVSEETKREQETIEEELSDQEPGPELTPEGLGEAEKIKGEKIKGESLKRGPKGETEDEVKS